MSEFEVIRRDKGSYAHSEDGEFPLTAESMVHGDVDPGFLITRRLEPGRIWPHTPHDYWIYTTAHHDQATPADLLVVLDGVELANRVHLTTVVDNLVARGELPPIVVVMVAPGAEGPGYPIYGGHDNRFVEYDVVGPALAEFVLDELLPDVQQFAAVTDMPERRGLFGQSSGGAAAFGVAWERPDAFHKVLSAVGSFVDIGGAHQYPSLIRRSERKPLRVYLQSGEKDLDTIFGNWTLANRAMASALAYREYEHHLEMGAGGHGSKHMAAALPDALRWLWR